MTNTGPEPDATDTETQSADQGNAQAPHEPDRMPTDDEVEAAERAGTEVPETVSDAYEQAAKTGAEVQGEGQIT